MNRATGDTADKCGHLIVPERRCNLPKGHKHVGIEGITSGHEWDSIRDARTAPGDGGGKELIAVMMSALKAAEKAEAALIGQWANFWDVAPQALIDELMNAQALRNTAIEKAEGTK